MWRSHWAHVIPFFAYPPEVRKMIYTTNAIESLNATLQRSVRIRGHFPNDEAAMRLIWLQLRELSTCPPDRSRHLRPAHFVIPLMAEADRLDSYPILPQGAYFAVTRWTNLFFTNDPIGGPLKPNFLNGIDDQNLGAGPSGLLGGKAHTSYWNRSASANLARTVPPSCSKVLH